MVVNILQNLSHKYFSYYSIIKYISFESIYYVFNLNAILFFMIFSEFDYVFL